MSSVQESLQRAEQALAEFQSKQTARLDKIEAENLRRNDQVEATLDRLNLTGGARPAESAGERACGLAFANLQPQAGPLPDDLKKGWERYLESGVVPLEPQAGMSVVSDPDGGFFVHPQVARQVARVAFDLSPVRQFSRVITLLTGDSYEENISTSLAAARWAGEEESRPETDAPDLKKTRITLRELVAMPRQTQKLLDTSEFDSAAWLTQELGEAFSITEGAAFINGDGNLNNARGFLQRTYVATADATRVWGDVEYIPTGAAGAFAASDPFDAIYDCVAALKTAYRPGAVWMMNRTTLAAVRKLNDTNGQPLWQPSNIVGRPSTLIGFPIVEAEDMPVVAADSLSIVLANFKRAYTIIDGARFTILRDPFTQKGSVLFYATKRVGGDMIDFNALKALKFAVS